MILNTLLNKYHHRINDVLHQHIMQLPFKNISLVRAIEYALLSGGKRLRPCLVYATGAMLHVEETVLDVPAAAIECIHAYSLIHDDLPCMDNDGFRRGHAACHIEFGEDIAILAGDALQSLAFSILSESPMSGVIPENRISMLSELSSASGVRGMCGGQAFDLSIIDKERFTLKELERVYRYKTGILIRAAVRLGALAAGEIGVEIMPFLDRFSNIIGLAFQIQDDILDFISDRESIEKKLESDQNFSKKTYPLLAGLANTKIKLQNLHQNALSELEILSKQSFNTTLLEGLVHFIIERDI
ncbi:(2E,6E)-farnesyl diphosphate synthase [Candidatus Erwinia haradaeae]|uniref:Farnesyl diphosphate synthase n=1 Tax=Candidatus Erwinia haradaeae TaxID=1922217 RepID=A0A451D879_9GAMM|nr:(2E,6E)-farnesyl diphosphate synthase [Candidatus Erwinia haradaeae]VFP81904.1 Farnesyl diphosphate synthase [Candidatus Erwinia haradaeae]